VIPGLIIGLLAVLALAYVTGPFRDERGDAPAADPDRLLEERKLAALTAILDLESERDVGKLSEEDLAELRVTYEAEALSALHELESDPAASSTGGSLEREIAQVRARLATDTCPECGARRAAASVCPRCGA
jgi:hypothetical protein